jgi:hypothetical protein
MATVAPYFDLGEMKDPYNHRLRLVESAQQRGLKPTARLFASTMCRSRPGMQCMGKAAIHATKAASSL